MIREYNHNTLGAHYRQVPRTTINAHSIIFIVLYVVYLGKSAPDMKDLSILKNPAGGPSFRLLLKIGGNWRTIGDLLGLEDYANRWAKLE